MGDISNVSAKELIKQVNQIEAAIGLIKAYLEIQAEKNHDIRENASDSEVGLIRFENI